MLQLLNPIWLLAVSAIIIPLAIHLWNVKRGKTLKIGSISLFGESSKQNSRSLRFLDLWLLFLRCLILISLAALLAGPALIEKMQSGKLKGWILLDKAILNESYGAFKPEVDSLINAGYETHFFNKGFKKFNLPDVLQKPIVNHPDSADQLSYWSLAKALDHEIPANTEVYIFTTNLLNQFKGPRPALRSKITWKTFAASDSIYNSISSAYGIPGDSIKIILSQSKASGTTFSTEQTSLRNLNPAFKLAGNSMTGIRFNELDPDIKDRMDSSIVPIDTTTLKIALYSEKYPADLAYLKAALRAVQSFSQRKISFITYRDANKIPSGLTWLLWLSEMPLTVNETKKAQNIFSYQPGAAIPLYHKIIDVNDRVIFSLHKTGLFKLNPVKIPNHEQSLWEDETGNPVLALVNHKNYRQFKFYSHFDPEWNDLVWSPEFPELLLELLYHHQENTALERSDRRTIENSQIITRRIKETAIASDQINIEQKSLEHYSWILLMVLFGLERWVTYKQKSRISNG